MGQDGEGRTCEMACELGGGEGRIAIHARIEDGFMFLGGNRQRAWHAL